MSYLSIFLVYLMMWMIVFFMSLPFGISISDNLEIGNANSAPSKTHLKLKILFSTLISIIPTYFIYWLIETEYLFIFIQNFDL
jgi:predicted secreted protein